MATQLSAITLIGTTGQGATDGLRFVQFYFGLPIAMVILGVTLVPFLHGAKVYTAYEFLERRFDARTRSMTSLLFLLSRGMSCGTIIAAPSVVLSSIFGWDLGWCVALIGIPTVLYTVLGGVQAVAWADVKQMFVIAGAMFAIITMLIVRMPIPLDDALHIAGAAGRLQVFDFSFDLSKTYTFWSGILGGTFLMLSYFGTDQSQVQRYLAAKSVDEARSSLLMSAYWKIPLQALILLTGVLVFLFYLFTPAPLLYNPRQSAQVEQQAPAEYASLQARYASAIAIRQQAAREAATVRHGGTDRLSRQVSHHRGRRHGDPQRGTRRCREGKRRIVARRELHHPALRARQSAAGVCWRLSRGGAGRSDVQRGGGAELTLHRHRDRLLSALAEAHGQ
jgi:Na+/proline symporter